MEKEREGMRVAVFDANTAQVFVGLGEIRKVEDIMWTDEDENGTEYIAHVTKDYPSLIVLDNGVETEGGCCWWTPVKPDDEELLRDLQLSVEEAKKYVCLLDDEDEDDEKTA